MNDVLSEYVLGGTAEEEQLCFGAAGAQFTSEKLVFKVVQCKDAEKELAGSE